MTDISRRDESALQHIHGVLRTNLPGIAVARVIAAATFFVSSTYGGLQCCWRFTTPGFSEQKTDILLGAAIPDVAQVATAGPLPLPLAAVSLSPRL